MRAPGGLFAAMCLLVRIPGIVRFEERNGDSIARSCAADEGACICVSPALVFADLRI